MELNQYIKQKLISSDSVKNYLRKEFVKIYNQIVVAMAQRMMNGNPVRKDSIEKYINGTFLLSEQAVKRYMDSLINSGIFVYNPATQEFSLPSFIIIKKPEIENDSRTDT